MDANVSRISRSDNHRECFQNLQNLGLIDYTKRGYEKWRWQYLENPFHGADELGAWVYISHDKAIGHLGAIPVKIKVGAKKLSAAWLVDFMTLKEYRRKGVGRTLLEEVDRQFDMLLSVGIADSSRNLFMKMGWEFLGDVPYYIKIWDLKPLIKKRIKNMFLAQFVSISGNCLFRIFDLFKRNKKPYGVEISQVDNFTEEADLFWQEIADSYKVIVPRNKDYLTWKYDSQPDMHYNKFCARRNGKVCGYAVVRCIENESSNPEGLISELIARPTDKDSLCALVLEVLKYVKGQGCSMARCYAIQKDIQKVLLLCGFIRYKVRMPFLIKKNIGGLEETSRLDNWYITAGDCDIDR